MPEFSDEPDDASDLERALGDIDEGVEVREQLQALTASAEGGAYFALVVVLGSPWTIFFGQLAKRLADDTYDAVREIFRRRRVIIEDGTKQAIIEPEDPLDSVDQLIEPPIAPSRIIRWDHTEGRWKGSDF
jgi:hypothetical protein